MSGPPGRTNGDPVQSETSQARLKYHDFALPALALGYLLVHLVTGHRYGFYRDELYYLVCGTNLAAGYVDHPPLVPVIAAVLRALGTDTVFCLRVLPAVSGALVVWLTGSLATRLGGGPWARVLAALAVCCAPLFLRSHTMLTPAAFETLLWITFSLALLRIVRDPRPALGLYLGLVLGAGLLNKYSFVFLIIALALGCLVSPVCRKAAHGGDETGPPWRALLPALVVAGLMIMPNLLWQSQNGWPTLEFLRNLRREILSQVTLLEFSAGQGFLLNPAAWPLWLAGLWWLLRRPEGAPYRAFGLSYVLLFLFFALTQGKIYYLLPAYPILGAAGAVMFETWWHGDRRRPLLATVVIAMIAAGLALAPLGLPLLPAARIDTYVKLVTGGRRDATVMAGHYADMHGWPELATAVAHAWDALPARQREQGFILAGNYGEASAIAVLNPAPELLPVYSGHNSYFLWGPPKEDREYCLAVGIPAARLAQVYETVAEVGVIRLPQAAYYEAELTLLLGHGLKLSWQEAWPWFRSYR